MTKNYLALYDRIQNLSIMAIAIKNLTPCKYRLSHIQERLEKGNIETLDYFMGLLVDYKGLDDFVVINDMEDEITNKIFEIDNIEKDRPPLYLKK